MKPRRLVPERLDAVGHAPAELRESLRHVAQVNRWLGGIRALHDALRPFSGEEGARPQRSVNRQATCASLRLLDVGTGNGALPLHLLEWSGDRGDRWSLVGLDRHPEIIPIAAERAAKAGPPFAVVRGDALRLPFPDASFDIALCTLTLHHFDDEGAVRLVQEMARVATRAVLVNDLERHRAAEVGARLLAASLWRGNTLTRHDGPASVRAAFTAEELLRIAGRAGLADATVRRHFPFRLLLRGTPGRSEG